jgi:hypothetical protein
MEAERMNASQLIQVLDGQKQAIQALIDQLDQVQVEFNAQFDEFQQKHDAALARLTDQVVDNLDLISSELRAAIEKRLPEERKQIDERRQKIREEYLPQRQQTADGLVKQAQAELAEIRSLNPQLDSREEFLKRQKAKMEARLEELNDEIGRQSRGLGVALHFIAITQADRERQRILGKLETINDLLYKVRREWEQEQEKLAAHQVEYQKKWQLESIAVARLQSELDQLDDGTYREDLALRRATGHVLDALDKPSPSSDSELEAGLNEMVQLNVQTDSYHQGLASASGFIGLLRGIDNGLQAVRQSIDGLQKEQEMHKAYLRPLSFSLPARVESLGKQWPSLAQQFADEKSVGDHPVDFAAATGPLLQGPLSEASIEAMFNDLGAEIKRATAQW